MRYHHASDMDASAHRPLRILAAGSGFDPSGLSHHMLHLAGNALAQALSDIQPDLLILDAARADAALDHSLSLPGNAGLPILLLVRPEDAEAAGLLLGHRIHLLDAPADSATLARAVEDLAQPLSAADGSRGFDPESRIAALRRDAERVAAALAELAGERPAGTGRPVDAARVRAHIRARRLRDRFFDSTLFADPGWDMLLDLFAARLEGRRVSVSSLCIAAAVPTTTALRWIKTMVDRGLFLRESDPSDARRAFITLAPATAAAMEACLEAVLNHPGQ